MAATFFSPPCSSVSLLLAIAFVVSQASICASTAQANVVVSTTMCFTSSSTVTLANPVYGAVNINVASPNNDAYSIQAGIANQGTNCANFSPIANAVTCSTGTCYLNTSSATLLSGPTVPTPLEWPLTTGQQLVWQITCNNPVLVCDFHCIACFVCSNAIFLRAVRSP